MHGPSRTFPRRPSSPRAPCSRTGEASYPFLRSQRANLRGALGFDYINQNVRFAGAALSRDRLRVAYLRLDADAVDVRDRPAPAWRLAGSVELRHGLDIFHASPRAVAGAVGPSPAGWGCRGHADPRQRAGGDVAGAQHHLLARAARAICLRSAAQLRGIFRRHLHDRPRLRSGHDHRRQRGGCYGGSAGEPDRAVRAGGSGAATLRLRRQRMGVEQEHARRSAADHLGRRRRADELRRSRAAGHDGGGADEPRRVANGARRRPAS